MTLNAAKLGLRRPATLADKQAITKADIQTLLGQTGTSVHSAYVRLMRLVYQNTFGLTPAEVGAALSQDESIELRTQAILIKSLINHLLPGTIDDIVPAATITLPENLFPEVE